MPAATMMKALRLRRALGPARSCAWLLDVAAFAAALLTAVLAALLLGSLHGCAGEGGWSSGSAVSPGGGGLGTEAVLPAELARAEVPTPRAEE